MGEIKRNWRDEVSELDPLCDGCGGMTEKARSQVHCLMDAGVGGGVVVVVLGAR